MVTHEVIYVSWYLHDRWSGNEESGSSLHLNLSDFEKSYQRYLSKFTRNDLDNSSHIPRKPQKAVIVEELFLKLTNSEYGLNLSVEEDVMLIKQGKILLMI